MPTIADPFDTQDKPATSSDPSTAPQNSIPEFGSGGGQSAKAGATAPSSSGLTQDFGKFKAANKNKITALGNLAVTGAGNELNQAGQAFGTKVGEANSSIQGQAKDYSKSAVAGLNTGSTIDADAIQKDWGEAKKPVDWQTASGQLAGTNEYQQYADTTNGLVNNLNNTAGISSAIRAANPNQVSSAAANQDAFLLRGDKNYNQLSNDFIKNNQNAANTSLASAQDQLKASAAKTDANNQAYVGQQLQALKNLQGGILSGVDKRVDAGRSAVKPLGDANIISAQIGENIAKQYGGQPSTPFAGTVGTSDDDLMRILANRAKDSINGGLSAQQMKQISDFISSDSERARAGINRNSILNQDSNLQAQLAALQKLGLSGGIDQQATISTPRSSLDALIAQITKDQVAGLRSQVKDPTTKGALEHKTVQDAVASQNLPGILPQEDVKAAKAATQWEELQKAAAAQAAANPPKPVPIPASGTKKTVNKLKAPSSNR